MIIKNLKFNMKNIFKLIFFFLIFLFFLFFSFKPGFLRDLIIKIAPTEVRIKAKEIVFGKVFLDNMRYYYEINYNEKKLPEIQFETLEIKYIDIKNFFITSILSHLGESYKTAFIEEYKRKGLMLITNAGDVKVIEDLSINQVINFNHNLKKNIRVVGSEKMDDTLFLAIYDITDGCSLITVQKGIIDNEIKKINFSLVFKTNECLDNGAEYGGELTFDYKKNKLYLTTAAAEKYEFLAQNLESIHGKIIEINLEDNNYKIYTKGHRNPQGLLFTKNNFIISTEHGSYGGDEINKIIEGKNYGWPISSYSEAYDFKIKNTNYYYQKSHQKYGYVEPIFSFIPSIGISKIIEVPNTFSKYMIDNYFITSLNRRSIYRVKFDQNFEKLLYSEEIRVGGRVRDIAFIREYNSFVLYLEDTEKLMVIKSLN